MVPRDTPHAMSEENAEAVRQRVAVRPSSRRSLEQRVLVRFPGLLPRVGRRVWRRPPRSRIRQAAIRRGARLAFEAINRRDYEAGFLPYSEDGETIYPAEFVQVGLGEATTRGRPARVDTQRRWDADWGEFRNELDEVIDLGDRALIVARMVGSGASSGASFDREVAYLLTVSDGLAIREQVFLSHREALEAAGLSE